MTSNEYFDKVLNAFNSQAIQTILKPYFDEALKSKIWTAAEWSEFKAGLIINAIANIPELTEQLAIITYEELRA